MSSRQIVRRAQASDLARDRLRRADAHAVSNRVVRNACRWVARTGLHSVLTDQLTASTGRPRFLGWGPFLTVLAIAAQRQEGSMLLSKADLVVAALTPAQRELIGLPTGTSYAHLESNLADLARATQQRIDPVTGEVFERRLSFDLDALVNAILTGSHPDCLGSPKTVSVDSTDCETYYRRQSRNPDGKPDVDPTGMPEVEDKAVSADGDNCVESESEPEKEPAPPGTDDATARKKDGPIWPRIGADGRKQHTLDPDAREGWRTKKQTAMNVFIGYDLHLVVDTTELGQEAIPGIVRALSVAPAGSSKTRAGMAALRHAPASIKTVLADRGYSYLTDWGTSLWERGLAQNFDLHTNQRGIAPGPRDGVIVVDGGFFTAALPERLRKLGRYLPGMTDADQLELAATYDERARYAFTPFGKPDSQGRLRFRGPALTKQVRCANHPQSLRAQRGPKRPTTNCRRGIPCACGTTFTATLHQWVRQSQHPIYGTSRWLAAYNRRVAVESTNAELKTNRFRFSRGSIRVRGLARHGILLAFMSAALNIAMLQDWFNIDWTELLEHLTPPPKLIRRGTTTFAKHRPQPEPPG